MSFLSEFFSQLHFIRPWLLLLILPAVAVFVLLVISKKRETQWTHSISEHLLPFLIDGKSSRSSLVPLIGLIIGWLLACLIAAGPTYKKIDVPVIKNESALVVLLDLSPSMRTEDLKPSRYERAKFKLTDLLEKRNDGVTALIAYAGDAHVVTPLTDDIRTIKSMLNGLSPQMMPVAGSNPEMAADIALKLLQETQQSEGTLLFMTDGIAPEAIDKLQDTIRSSNYNAIIWGIGTSQGAPIPSGDGRGFIKRNSDNSIVVAKLDEDQLSEAAIATRGIYIPFSNTSFDVDSVVRQTSISQASSEFTSDAATIDVWEELGIYLCFLLIPLAAFSFRRGWLLSLLFVTAILPTEYAQALGWKDLWLNDSQQAKKALDKGEYEAATELFNDESWKAYSAYKNNDFEKTQELIGAEDASKQSLTNLYNSANASVHLEKYDEAIALYDQVLTKNPNFTQAKDNKNIAEQLKKLQEQSQQQNGESGESGENDPNSQNDNQQQSSENSESDDQQAKNNSSQNSEQNQSSDSGESDNQSQSESSQNANNSNEKPSDSSEPQENALSEEQREALQDKYGKADGEENKEQQAQTDEKKTEPQQDEENKNAEQAAAQQQAQKNDEDSSQQSQSAAPKNIENDKNTKEESEQAQAALQRQTAEEQEAQQTLEQWLRKVPEDPSTLLRNKFHYKSRNRQIENEPLFFDKNSPTERL